MASIPTPRSYQQTVADILDAVLQTLGIPSLPVGDPILAIVEAAAQSDVRGSQDLFEQLKSLVLDYATGSALERLGADEDLVIFPASVSSGIVTISDTSFVKKQSSVFLGLPAPIIGSTVINVPDASGWPATGQIYIGRGTNQFEGPLSYSSITPNTGYYSINLTSSTQRFHNLGENVVLAQGGDRLISSGTICEASQGLSGQTVKFSTLYDATLPDGETSILGVTVVAVAPGLTGNVSSDSITNFPSPPFTGAAVSNPAPFTSGRATETEGEFKERIRATRQSRSKGTSLAIKTAATGVIDQEENKRTISASVVTREGYPTTLYIDDGSGYEEQTAGAAYEIITDSASGGEQYFSLANTPVAKAFSITSSTAPFALSSGAKLAVKIGNVVYEHTFSSDSFRSISNASAFEVVSSINGDPTLKLSARTAASGTKVSIFADDDTNESIEVIAPTSGTDANNVLGFSVGETNTISLYKNDRLLNKDGSDAILISNPQSQWSSMSNGETIEIVVDGINVSGISDTYSILDTDFVSAGTPYATVAASNSLDSWAKVLNRKIPGIVASEISGTLSIKSKLGKSSQASVQIKSGTLVTKGMFNVSSVLGSNKDYSLNRNLSQLRLEDTQTLLSGDRLSAGSLYTRGFIESSALSTVNLASDAELWFFVDGATTLIPTAITTGTTVTYTVNSAQAWGDRVRATVAASSFADVLIGDWLIVNDPALPSDAGAFRIVNKSNTFLEIERPTSYVASGAVALTAGGFYVVRSESQPQKIVVPTGTNYTALSLVQSLNTQLRGATASVYRTNRIRIATNNFELGDGEICLVAANTEGLKLSLPVSSGVKNTASHLPSVISSNSQVGTPKFNYTAITSTSGVTNVAGAALTGVDPGHLLVGLKSTVDTGDLWRYSNDGAVSSIVSNTAGSITLRKGALSSWLAPGDIVYEAYPYSITAEDTLLITTDDDALNKRFSVNMFRNGTPRTSTYGSTNSFADLNNSSLSLAQGFGTTFNWQDFAVWMKARTKTHLSAGVNTTKTILYRYFRYGAEGEASRLQYRYPKLASSGVSIEVDSTTSDNYAGIKVLLPTSAARAAVNWRNNTKIGIAVTASVGGLYTHCYTLGFDISTASRTANVTTATLALPPAITDHGLIIGNQIYVDSVSGFFTSGVKTITARTATTVSYAETAADRIPTASIGSTSFDIAGLATVGPNVINGDIFGVQTGTGLSPFDDNATKLSVLDVSGRYFFTNTDKFTVGVSTTLQWLPISDTTKLSFYPLNAAASTATLITTAVNALSNSPVTAVAVGGGAGVLNAASYEVAELGATDPWYYLTDGVNYIQSNTIPVLPADPVMTFKKPITASLAVNSDWGNEIVKIIPVTAKNVVDYLNSSTTSGLSSAAEVVMSDNGSVQISSLSAGSTGSVQVQGGTANSTSASVQGSAIAVGSSSLQVGIASGAAVGLSGDMWVSLQNSIPVNKAGVFTGSTVLSSLTTGGNFTLSGTQAWTYAGATAGIIGGATGATWQFIKQGKYVQARCVSNTFTGVVEGDVIIVKSLSGTTANDGTFRVIRTINNNIVWIENPNCFEAIQASAVAFLKYDSVLPGNILQISTPIWGNIGSYAVKSIDLPSSTLAEAPFNGTGSVFKFAVDSSMTAIGPTAALGTSSSLVQITENTASKLIKRIVGIYPDSSNAASYNVTFDSRQGSEKVGAFAGTLIQPADKLQFGVDLHTGTDGYSYNTGLLAEVNRVTYGVPSSPSLYPGVIAAGAKVNISGPLVKRIQLALGIRVKTGIASEEVFRQVRSDVASVVNNTPVGGTIAISDLVRAAQEVTGVVAVSVLSPTYGISNDLIILQPFEKPLVLNVDTDILISLVGA